jgi:NADPH2:quinone reductase
MTDHVTRIITAPEPGGPDALRVEERRLAPAGPGEVLIDVAGAGINRPDIFERLGFYPPPPGAPEGLGLEVSGIVREAGPGADFKAGDKVVALVAGGGYADIARANASSTLPAPKGRRAG